MKKRSRFRKTVKIIFLLLTIGWIYVAQFMMEDRLSDSYAHKVFSRKDIALTTNSIKAAGRNMHYAKTGNDSLPTIVFIHGSPGSWSAFMGYLYDKELMMKYRLVSVDRPGLGYSDFGSTLNLEKQSVLISLLLDSLSNGKPLFLVGHSLGGPLIVKIAGKRPGSISGLVIIAGALDPSLEKKEYWRPVLIWSPLRWLVPSGMRYSNEELWYLKNDLKEMKPDFTKINCPVLLFHGDNDDLVPLANTVYAQKMLTSAASVKLIIFPGANHFIVWTKFEEIKNALLHLREK